MDNDNLILIAAIAGAAYLIYKNKTSLSPKQAKDLINNSDTTTMLMTPERADAMGALPNGALRNAKVVTTTYNQNESTTLFFDQNDLNNLSGFQRTLLWLGISPSKVV